MLKKFCPYCDHEIKGAGKCVLCGSRVRKPVLVETSAEYATTSSAMPGDCDCRVHSPQEHPHSDRYRDSTDASFERDYKEAYESDRASIRNRANQTPRRIVQTKGNQKGNVAKKIVIIYIAVIIISQIISVLFALFSNFR